MRNCMGYGKIKEDKNEMEGLSYGSTDYFNQYWETTCDAS